MQFIPPAKLIEEHYMVQEIVHVAMSHWLEKARRQLAFLHGYTPRNNYLQFRRGKIKKKSTGRLGTVFFGVSDGLAWNEATGGIEFTATEVFWLGKLHSPGLSAYLTLTAKVQAYSGIELGETTFKFVLRRDLTAGSNPWSVEKMTASNENATAFLRREDRLNQAAIRATAAQS